MMLEHLDSHKKENFHVSFIQYTKINSIWIIDLNVNLKTIKFLEGNKGENLCGIGLGRFLRNKMKNIIH